MAKITGAISASLDALRRLTLGGKAKLAVLDNDPTRGYTKTVDVTKGWLVSDESEGEAESDGQLKVEVAESTAVTETILREVAAFAFQPGNEAQAFVCTVQDRKEPLGEFSRVWTLYVTPTGEKFTI